MDIALHGSHAARPSSSLKFEFWQTTGCNVVFSEDMKDGQSYDGVLIENPFSR
jgi:predicted nucleic acid-binding protein